MRSVLIVSERNTETCSYIRAGQYDEHFQKCDSVQASYTFRKGSWFGLFDSRVFRGLKRLGFSEPMRILEEKCDKGQEGRILAKSRNCDLVYLVRVPSWRLHKAMWDEGRTKIVMDLNDGLWLPYNRQLGYEQIEDMLRHSHAVTCENDVLSRYAMNYNSKVYTVPDCPQVEEFDRIRQQSRSSSGVVTLGWIGSARTADNLSSIFEPLEELFKRYEALHLRVLGANPSWLPRFEAVRFSYKTRYSNEEMVEEALHMDIGLFPLYRIEDSRARGTLKARIYMAAGIAAVCQDWGENSNLIQHRRNGILATSSDDWFNELEWLIKNPTERKAIARRGLSTIRSHFTRQACFDRLRTVFDSV